MNLVPRSKWGARWGRGDPVTVRPVPRVVVHHSYRPNLYRDLTLADASRHVRQIEEYHVTERGWVGIGYNWLVDQDGRVFEGRGWGRTGAHAQGVNSRSVGICFLIDGDAQPPSEPAWGACEDIIRQGLRLGEIAPHYIVSGHRDHSATDCPGELVYAEMGRLRGLTPDWPEADPADPSSGLDWPVPEMSVPTPAPPRAPTERLRLDPIEVPDRAPIAVERGGWLDAYRWAREVAENIGAEAFARRASGTERLVADALERLMPSVARLLPPWLFALVWPLVERAAYRTLERLP